MGYETTVYIVDHYGEPKFETDGWAEGKKACYFFGHISTMKLCQLGGDSELSKLFDKRRARNKKNGYYPFCETRHSDDAQEERPIIRDKYDSPLGHHKGVDVLQALERTCAQELLDDGRVYRRHAVFLAMLRSVLEVFPPERIWVLTFGH